MQFGTILAVVLLLMDFAALSICCLALIITITLYIIFRIFDI